jgi:hypothetical protein
MLHNNAKIPIIMVIIMMADIKDATILDSSGIVYSPYLTFLVSVILFDIVF